MGWIGGIPSLRLDSKGEERLVLLEKGPRGNMKLIIDDYIYIQ